MGGDAPQQLLSGEGGKQPGGGFGFAAAGWIEEGSD
jgi:hypothetical protein